MEARGDDFLNLKISQLEIEPCNRKSQCEDFADIIYNTEGKDKAEKKVGPVVPPKPKPYKSKQILPQIPQSSFVKQTCEPLYSQRLRSLDNELTKKKISENVAVDASITGRLPLHRKRSSFSNPSSNIVTLDNPAVLEQQLEALAHHKKQLEKMGLLQQKQDDNRKQQYSSKSTVNNSCIPKLSLSSLLSDTIKPNKISCRIYENTNSSNKNIPNNDINDGSNSYSNIPVENDKNKNDMKAKEIFSENPASNLKNNVKNNLYSNVTYELEAPEDFLPAPTALTFTSASFGNYLQDGGKKEEDIPPPPSPVSSSYSELRRATETFSGKHSLLNNGLCTEKENKTYFQYKVLNGTNIPTDKNNHFSNQAIYQNVNYGNDSSIYSSRLQSISQNSSDYYGYGGFSQDSSTYESIYEPINPRPPSQLSSQSNYLMYAPYVNEDQIQETNSAAGSSHKSLTINSNNSTTYGTLFDGENKMSGIICEKPNEAQVDVLTDYLVHSMDPPNTVDSYGICFKCNEPVLGENSGCTAMEQIYHITCFTCTQCQVNLQGKPFYALDFKPYCEYDYLQTLEKCSVCMKPILERILRATGKPYHPQCFTCIVCGNSLDGIPFTVDATNQNYCIEDFHRKFAPRCCVCKEPIMPDSGEEETVRVVALDRSFHFECYKCEDCGLLLSSEAEGRGCYPLDDHIFCKSCNAKRVQMLTNKMTTEL